MRRFVSVWLPAWPIERIRLKQSKGLVQAQDRHPTGTTPKPGPDTARQVEACALVATGRHGLMVTAITDTAAAGGVRPGMALADARALMPGLRTQPAQPTADRRALIRLARWCGRYGPARNIDIGPVSGSAPGDLLLDHGLWIDITGVAHLFGGEEALADDLATRLTGFGLTACLGLADTLGAAHALARFATPVGPRRRTRFWISAPAGETAATIAPLPVEALRLAPTATVTLRRLGLRRIGDLYDMPRATLERRFRETVGQSSVITRLDHALGRAPEPRRPLIEVPDLVVRRAFPAPLISSESLEAEARLLVDELCTVLEARGLGVRRVRIVLYRSDGTTAGVVAGTSTPVRNAARITALLAGKLASLDAGLGLDMLAVEVPIAERLAAGSVLLTPRHGDTAVRESAELADRLSNRLGAHRVTTLVPRTSHIPEHSEIRHPLLRGDGRARWSASGPLAAVMRTARRPAILLPHPEPIAVTAEVPDGAPAVFTWRRTSRRITRAEGPERIAPEWWRALATASDRPESPDLDALGTLQSNSDAPRTRDYYRIEDSFGAGYWVFRNGLYDDEAEEGIPTWFLHGFFA